jgi:two-component system phosphate regulon response regulator PhoB
MGGRKPTSILKGRGRRMNQVRKEIPRPGAASAPRILLVEDESDLALLLAYNLEAEGYGVESVERGDEVELRLAENPPDLVILDWMLPGVSGVEICSRLRARENTRTLPVIMVTARGEEAERVRGLSVGADDYVVKPFSVPELMARVRALLRRSRPERIADRLNAGDLDLDRETRRVRRGSRDIQDGTPRSRSARSTSISDVCVGSCRRGASVIRSALFAASATPSTRPLGSNSGQSDRGCDSGKNVAAHSRSCATWKSAHASC